MRRSLAVLLTLLIFSSINSWVSAQEGALIVVIDDIVVDQYAIDGTIQLHVTVRHPKGGAITDLGPEAFTVAIDDKAYVPIQAQIEDSAPVSLAVVLELYRTMSGEPFDQAKTAIGRLFTTKPPRDRVAFFGVRPDADPDSDVIDEAYERDFTNDGGAVNNFVQSAVELVTTGPGTPLYDSLIRTFRFTGREPVGRNAIVVITDGGDVGSRFTADAVIDAAEELKIPVYSIGYTGNNRLKDQFLNELAKRTGGRYQNTPDAADFDQFLDDVRRDMAQNYLLSIEPESLESGRRILEVRAEVAGLNGSHSRQLDIETGSATATPPSATTTPDAPPVPLAEDTPIPTEPSVTPTPTAGPVATKESTDTGGTIVDTIQDNPAIVAAIAGGLLLFFVILIVIAVLLGRRKRKPEQAWEPEPDAYAPSFYQYDAVSEAGAVQPSVPSSPTAGAGMVAGTEVAPAGQPMGTAPDIGFQPPPPMPGQQPPPPQAPPANADGTMIIERGPKMTRQAMLIERQRPENKYDLTKPSVNLGRAASNDITVDNATISRQHAIIKLDQDDFRIYDLGSSNGTFVNDQRVVEPIVLQDGDIVRLGDMAFIFKVISLEG
jgi:VWFA-related protein